MIPASKNKPLAELQMSELRHGPQTGPDLKPAHSGFPELPNPGTAPTDGDNFQLSAHSGADRFSHVADVHLQHILRLLTTEEKSLLAATAKQFGPALRAGRFPEFLGGDDLVILRTLHRKFVQQRDALQSANQDLPALRRAHEAALLESNTRLACGSDLISIVVMLDVLAMVITIITYTLLQIAAEKNDYRATMGRGSIDEPRNAAGIALGAETGLLLMTAFASCLYGCCTTRESDRTASRLETTQARVDSLTESIPLSHEAFRSAVREWRQLHTDAGDDPQVNIHIDIDIADDSD